MSDGRRIRENQLSSSSDDTDEEVRGDAAVRPVGIPGPSMPILDDVVGKFRVLVTFVSSSQPLT